MRGAHRVAGLALSLAMFGFGCGDDSVAVDAAVDANMADHPNVDHPVVDGAGSPDAGPSVTIAAVELHGTVQIGGNLVPVMKAAVSVSTTPSDFVPDFASGSFPSSCAATAYDVTASTPKFPPPTYDMGNVVVTMYTGVPIGAAHPTTTCAFNAAGYNCDFPDVGYGSGNYPEVNAGGTSTPQHWITPGTDRLNFNIAGSSGISALNFRMPAGNEASGNFAATATAVQGTVNATGCTGGSAVQLQGNTNAFAFNQDMLVKVDCGTGTACGLVAVSMTASDTANPGRGAGLTCTRLIGSPADNCVRIPAGALQVLHYSAWDTAAGAHIQTSLVHFGGTGFTMTPIGGTTGGTIGAAQGQFFIRVP
jgi:hypothetical protein